MHAVIVDGSEDKKKKHRRLIETTKKHLVKNGFEVEEEVVFPVKANYSSDRWRQKARSDLVGKKGNEVMVCECEIPFAVKHSKAKIIPDEKERLLNVLVYPDWIPKVFDELWFANDKEVKQKISLSDEVNVGHWLYYIMKKECIKALKEALINTNKSQQAKVTTSYRVSKPLRITFNSICASLNIPKSDAIEYLLSVFITVFQGQMKLDLYSSQTQILQQFFINKPKQVNIAEKQVVVKQIDYSDLPLEELQKRYDLAKKRGESVEVQFLSFELKKRQSKAFLERNSS